MSQTPATYGVHLRIPGGAGWIEPYRAAPNTIAPMTGIATCTSGFQFLVSLVRQKNTMPPTHSMM